MLSSDNQPPPYADVDLFGSDPALVQAVHGNGAAEDERALMAFGRRWGLAAMFDQARSANDDPPRLVGEPGERRDGVEFNPAYHDFMRASLDDGLHAMTWRANGARAPAPAEVARAARFYMVAQVENGHMCPVTMTRAAVAALAAQPDLLAQVMPKIVARRYDPDFRPWTEKAGITIGMGMTEKQGGTDVRANTTRAVRTGDGYRITGHKWFMSAPMCDAFLVLAQAPDGLTCFFMPRCAPDSSVNGLLFQKLKDKLGNRSNASSEVEFADAYALRVGEEGHGIRTIIEMVQLTRLDCAISSAGLMRAALARALHHVRHRIVFQKRLVDQPMMRAVLADMALMSEAAMALTMRLARAFDLAPGDPAEAARARLLTPVVKYWVCKSAPALVYEAMECLGGNGYVEDSVLPRLYREAPVNAIWEGSGNVMCLDVLRALTREGDAARSVLAGLAHDADGLPGADEAVREITGILTGPDSERLARAGVERLALFAAAAALRDMGSPAAELFARTHLAGARGVMLGTAALDVAQTTATIGRACPE
jgi:putative acyl-CoA dehydrogenase